MAYQAITEIYFVRIARVVHLLLLLPNQILCLIGYKCGNKYERLNEFKHRKTKYPQQ